MQIRKRENETLVRPLVGSSESGATSRRWTWRCNVYRTLYVSSFYPTNGLKRVPYRKISLGRAIDRSRYKWASLGKNASSALQCLPSSSSRFTDRHTCRAIRVTTTNIARVTKNIQHTPFVCVASYYSSSMYFTSVYACTSIQDRLVKLCNLVNRPFPSWSAR